VKFLNEPSLDSPGSPNLSSFAALNAAHPLEYETLLHPQLKKYGKKNDQLL
jgi:hypothetical protein